MQNPRRRKRDCSDHSHAEKHDHQVLHKPAAHEAQVMLSWKTKRGKPHSRHSEFVFSGWLIHTFSSLIFLIHCSCGNLYYWPSVMCGDCFICNLLKSQGSRLPSGLAHCSPEWGSMFTQGVKGWFRW